VGQLEGRIIREADAVIATAMGLFDEANRKNPNARFISNGVDFSLFQKEGPEEGFLARHGIEKGKWKGIVAFVGGIHEWVDLALVGEAAAALPGYLFVMAGPVAVNIDKFSNINNIRFIGMIDRREVPSLLAESDVCISPFVVNRLSHYVNPLKVYEYLAAGKPVVSVPMPEISSLASVISFAGGAEEFGQAICRESAEDDGEKIKRRKEISQDFDWGRIQDKALQVIEPFFQARPQE
jgi:glycosyltransferase involved in cell wall biosynthesis